LVLSVLERELLSITGGKEASHLTKLNKITVIWKQDQLKELLLQVRGQQIGLNLLISALQTWVKRSLVFRTAGESISLAKLGQ
jgi:hypothetical protein